jgi:RNA polymerase sigma-70 factor (ECF subfamily)
VVTELLAAARQGDDVAFAQLVEPFRGELHAYCYRMLGSVFDAEDALQDALLGAWRGLGRFEGRSSLRSWLYTIATNACLKTIERRPKRVLPIDYGPAADPHDALAEPLTESVWIDRFPDEKLTPDARCEQRESIELAFIAALQHLPAAQRAVLILRDVLGFTGAEVAEALETTPASVYSALQRAHKTVNERRPEHSQQATLRALGDDGLRHIVTGFVDAWERNDVGAIVAQLADNAALTMPPRPSWFRGRAAIATFLRTRALAPGTRWRNVPTRANGQPAFGHYLWISENERFMPHGIVVLTLEGDRIGEITSFLNPLLFARFGLPDGIDA